MRRQYLFIIILLILNGNIFAQWTEANPIQYEMSRVQNDKTSLEPIPSARKVSVDGSGDFSFDIPLINIPGRRKLSFDINLTYAPGITVPQESGMVGLGWSINIGSIKRNPIIQMDNHIAKINDPNNYNSQFRDMYSVTCPAGSGTILQFPSGNNNFGFELERYRDWEITNLPTNNSNSNKRNRFVIVSEDGTTYVFGLALGGLVSSSFGYDSKNSICGPTSDPYLEWKLTSILGPDYIDGDGDALDPLDSDDPISDNKGEWIAIEYDENEFEKNLNNEIDYAKWYVYFSNEYFVSSNEVTYPYRIITPLYVAEFEMEKETRNTRSLPFYRTDGDDIMAERDDDFVTDISAGNGYYKQRVKRIALYNNIDGKGSHDNVLPVQVVDFTYYDEEERTTLKQLQFITKDNINLPPFKFEYYNTFGTGKDLQYEISYEPNCYNSTPNYNCSEVLGRVGYGGFYNGEDDFPNGRIGKPSDGRAWNLKTITYPAGSNIKFDYQSDYYHLTGDPKRYGYGVRLLSQTISDANSSSKRYDYTYENFNTNGSSAGDCGILYISPLSDFRFHFPFSHSASPTLYRGAMAPVIEHKILYEKVTEKNSNDNSSISYYFNVRKYDINERFPNNTGMESPSIILARTLALDGSLKKIEYKNNNNAIIKSEEFTQTLLPKNSYGINNEASDASPYNYFISVIKSEETHSTTLYDPDGKNGITTTDLTEYNDSGFPETITETNSDGKIKTTFYKWVSDYPYFGYEGDEYSKAIWNMQDKGIKNALIEKTIKENSNTIAADLILYKTIYDDAVNNRIYPFSRLKLSTANSVTDFTPSEIWSKFNYFNYDSRYQVVQTFDSYDNYGNPLQSYDNYGNLLQMTDANGIITKYTYGYKNSKSIGTIQNCGSSANEIYIDDFNDGSIVDNSPVTYSYKTGASVDNGYLTMLSGIVSIPSLNYQSFNADFSTKIDNSNGWIGIQFGATTTDVVASGLIVYYTYNGTISLYDKRTLLTSASTGKVGNVWRRISLNVSGSSIKVYLDGSSILNYTYSSAVPTGIVALHSIDRALVDNFRVYPGAAQAVSYAYDPETLNLTEEVDQNGVPTFYKYDGFSRPIQKLALVDGKKALLEEYRYTVSRTVGDVYDPARPNAKETIAFLNSTGYSDFTNSDGWTVNGTVNGTEYIKFNQQFNGETCIKMASPSTANWLSIATPAVTGKCIAKVDFLPNASIDQITYILMFHMEKGTTAANRRACLQYNYSTKRFRVQYNNAGEYKTTTDFGPTVDLTKQVWYTAELEKTESGEVYCFIYKRGEGRIYNSDYMYIVTGIDPTWDPKVVCYTNDDYFYLSNFYYGQIDRTVEYLDGEGKLIQTQRQNGDTTVVLSTTEYDALGRPYRTFKPYQIVLSGYARHAYDAGYYNKDAGTGNVVDYYKGLGDYKTSYPDGENPYSENSYYTDPLNRVNKISFPGTSWAMGSTHEKQFAYTGITDENSFEYFKTTSTDEQGISTDTYTDKFGNTVKTAQDPTGLNLTTTFTYDILGNLLSSTDPKGYPTNYIYNTLGQLTKKASPDAGTVEYLYDKVGNLRLIKDANHIGVANSINLNGSTASSGTFEMKSPGKIKVFVYSNLTIPTANISVAIRTSLSGYYTTLYTISTTAAIGGKESIIYLPKGTYRYEVTLSSGSSYTITSLESKEFEYRKYDVFNRLYDIGEYMSNSVSSTFAATHQNNANNTAFPTSGIVRNKYYYYDGPSPMAVASGQRNLKGRVSYASTYQDGTLHQHTFYSYDDLGRVEWVVQYFATGYNAKIKYNYDLQGKLVKKEYLQTNNNMYTFYEYDQMQRLINVNTGRYENGSEKIPEASYTYNAGGTVKRLKLGNAQGVDYCYNSRDWLCSINNQNLDKNTDPGRDGITGSATQVDKFGMVIGYQTRDHIGTIQNAPLQYNGNISWQMYNISGLLYRGYPLVGNTYTYDKANRLKTSNFGYYTGSWTATNSYDVNFSYDKNGNITDVNRYGTDDMLEIDYMQQFQYFTNTNKLQWIFDDGDPAASGSDIDHQSTNNYAYDANGNLTQDLQNGVGFIYYDINNLPLKMYKTNGTVLEYGYDATGNRSYNKPENRYYINNLSGANEAVASSVTSTTVSYNIYGNDNIGLIDKIGTTYNRYYYLKDHLGSIRVRVNSTGTIVVGWHDYYPFGMTMDGRDYTAGGSDIYKYTGKERDAATRYDYFGARYYDGRIGRWLSVDPLAGKYPGWCPYNYTYNNPMRIVDPDGKEGITATIILGRFAFGAIMDAGIQVATNMSVNNKGFFESVGDIDIMQSLASGTASALTVPGVPALVRCLGLGASVATDAMVDVSANNGVETTGNGKSTGEAVFDGAASVIGLGAAKASNTLLNNARNEIKNEISSGIYSTMNSSQKTILQSTRKVLGSKTVGTATEIATGTVNSVTSEALKKRMHFTTSQDTEYFYDHYEQPARDATYVSPWSR